MFTLVEAVVRKICNLVGWVFYHVSTRPRRG